MQKLSYTFALLLAASLIFSSCRNDDDNGNGNNNPGIGEPTATTDPGVIINEIRWATRNVAAPGTFAETPESLGMFFQWNRRTGWSATDPMISSPADAIWDHTDATGGTWTRANDPCPPGWRVPTRAEFNALNDIRNEWTAQSGVNGRVFRSGSNTLFLPAAGIRPTPGAFLFVGTFGYYWSSSPSALALNAMYLHIQQGGSDLINAPRAHGLSVRCVAE